MVATTSPIPLSDRRSAACARAQYFGYDIGGGAWDAAWFEAYFKSVSLKTNSVRFFLHCDGRASPHFGADGLVLGLAQPDHGGEETFVRELKALVALAARYKLVLQIVLWSFDMCKNEGFPLRIDLVADVAKTQSYIERALNPLLDALKATGCADDASCLVEVYNEPEWCVTDKPQGLDQCQGVQCVTAAEMQRFVAALTYAIHLRTPRVKVTVGAASLKWSTDRTKDGRGVAALWTDAALTRAHADYRDRAARSLHKAKGGATLPPKGVPLPPRPTLDLYNAHFWNWQERFDGFGPCQEDVAFWHLDKPIVFAELPAHIHSHVDRCAESRAAPAPPRCPVASPAHAPLHFLCHPRALAPTASCARARAPCCWHSYSKELLECILRHRFNGGLFWAFNDPGSKLLDAVDTLAAASSAANPLVPAGAASYEALLTWLQATARRRGGEPHTRRAQPPPSSLGCRRCPPRASRRSRAAAHCACVPCRCPRRRPHLGCPRPRRRSSHRRQRPRPRRPRRTRRPRRRRPRPPHRRRLRRRRHRRRHASPPPPSYCINQDSP